MVGIGTSPFPWARPALAVLAGAACLVAPFAALELLNAPVAAQGFPTLLFAFMLGHAALMVAMLMPAVRHVMAVRSLRGLSGWQMAGVTLGVGLLALYGAVVADQMGCFLGVPNCD